MWKVRTELGIAGLCEELRHAYEGTDDVYVHFDMDILCGAGPAPGDILGELAEPMGMTDYEIIRLAHEIGKQLIQFNDHEVAVGVSYGEYTLCVTEDAGQALAEADKNMYEKKTRQRP